MKSVPTDIHDLTSEYIFAKFKAADAKAKELYRTGKPYIRWMQSYEDDSRIRIPRKGYTDGVPTFDQLWSGLVNGMAFIGARANCGKSTAIITLMKGAIELNNDTICVDFSLDDPEKKRLEQFVSCISGVSFTDITLGATLSKHKQDLVDEAENRFFGWLKDGRLFSLSGIETIGGKRIYVRDYKTICYAMRYLRERYPRPIKLIFGIDALNNLDVTLAKAGSELAQWNEALAEIKGTSEDNDIIVLLPAHLRKGEGRRPTVQDFKGTSNIEYDATSTLLLRNELREGVPDPVMYEEDDGEESTIIAFECVKTKCSNWDKTLLMKLNAECCRIEYLPTEEYMRYWDIYKGKKR